MCILYIYIYIYIYIIYIYNVPANSKAKITLEPYSDFNNRAANGAQIKSVKSPIIGSNPDDDPITSITIQAVNL